MNVIPERIVFVSRGITVYFVKHDDEISTSAIRIIISLLEPTL